MQSLIDMDFWSVRTVVEDGHQFWRSYFHFDGDYRVYPFSIPIYQDAVLADGYMKTIKAQFIQLRRWTYGASDIAYIADKGFWHENKIPKLNVLGKLLRTLEGHVTWATGVALVFVSGFIPPLLHPQNLAANELPLIVSRLQRVGLATAVISVISASSHCRHVQPRHKRYRSVLMVAQWALAPITSFCFGSLAAFNSQTRLMFGWYLSKFDLTEKATVDTQTHKKHRSRASAPRSRELHFIRFYANIIVIDPILERSLGNPQRTFWRNHAAGNHYHEREVLPDGRRLQSVHA